jgi:hypothetical protein
MNNGRTVFSQLIEYLPNKEFQKCVSRYHGDLDALRRLHIINESDYGLLSSGYLFLRDLIDALRIVRGDASDWYCPLNRPMNSSRWPAGSVIATQTGE